MDVRLLGPVAVRDGDRLLDLGTPRQRAVLAVLAVDAGRPVRADALIDRVWNEQPPRNPRAALYGYVSRLRRVLPGAGPVRSAGGYLLPVEPEQIDLHRSRRLVRRARAGADPRLLGQALALWCGTPLADLSGDWAARTRDAWCHEHLDLVAAWGQAELDAGRPDEVIDVARPLVVEHPLAEPVVGLLIRALHGAGHEGEAQAAYAEVRNPAGRRARHRAGRRAAPQPAGRDPAAGVPAGPGRRGCPGRLGCPGADGPGRRPRPAAAV